MASQATRKSRSIPLPTAAKKSGKSRMPRPSRKDGSVARIKVTIVNIRPPVWRRLEVPLSSSFGDLHDILQIAFAWQDYHLHLFDVAGVHIGTPDDEWEEEVIDEEQVRLGQLLETGDRFRYEYDFGDDWTHHAVVEDIVPPDPAATHPRCLGGRRAAPPEDSGGPWGYARMLEILADPDDEDHDEIAEWIGQEWDPDAFDRETINRELASLGRAGRR
jgi:hypothetical protein